MIIPTPIGNMSDISLNVQDALKEVDTLLCESISNTKKLFQILKLPMPNLVRYWQKTEAAIVENLDDLKGEKIGLISDAGMPCISDPGYQVVLAWHRKKWPVSAISGPSVVPMAVAMSGLPSERFAFDGFLPQGEKKKEAALVQIKDRAIISVVYESPRRVMALLEAIKKVFGDEHIVFLAKELTKKHEWYCRDKVIHAIDILKKTEIKGEYVLVIDRQKQKLGWEKDALIAKECLSLGDAALVVSNIHGVSRSKVYDFLLEKD